MKITFIGAAHEVTGSCTLLQLDSNKNILIDCGMEQGPDIYENQSLPILASKIDAVFLTHAHIDHSGLLPLLYKQGFRGEIYSTRASKQLCSIMLLDSAHIQEFEAEWRNRKGRRVGREEYKPIYNQEDAKAVMTLFRPCEYNIEIDIFKNLKIKFLDAGHLLGSSSIEIKFLEANEEKTIIFSGDIGNFNKPILKDPTLPKKADYVVMESTYGDRFHGNAPDYVKELTDILIDTFNRGGNVVIPSFAVGRTQEILYFLREIKEKNLVSNFKDFPVYIDSPMAVECTKLFMEREECFDNETLDLINKGINPISFSNLHMSITADDSKLINFDKTPKVIISASGMCEAGRIKHHLKHNLWREDSTILFVGYQVEGTIGRKLLEGASTIKLFGEKISVNAKICKLNAISSHADQNGLLNWVNNLENKPKCVFVNHGDKKSAELFKDILKDNGYNAIAPYSGDEWDLNKDIQLKEGNSIEKNKEKSISLSKGAKKRLEYLNTVNDMLDTISDMVSDNVKNQVSNEEFRKVIDKLNSIIISLK